MEEIQGKLRELCRRLTRTENPFLDLKMSSQDYLSLFEAVVGFSHFSTRQNLTCFAWNQIQGQQNVINLSSGWTKCNSDFLPGDITFPRVIDRPHDIFKSIYFNRDQLIVLLNYLPFVLFAADYSAGKLIQFNI